MGFVPEAVEFGSKTLFLGRVKTGMEDLASVVVDTDFALSFVDVIGVESIEELDPITGREQDLVALTKTRRLDHDDSRTYDREVEAPQHNRFETLDIDLQKIDIGDRRIRQNFGERTNGHHDIGESMPLFDVRLLHVIIERRQTILTLVLTKHHLARSLSNTRGDEYVPVSDGVLPLHQRIGIDIDTAPATLVKQPSHRVQPLVIAADIDVETWRSVTNERPEIKIFPILGIRHKWPARVVAHTSNPGYRSQREAECPRSERQRKSLR